ncbi:MAG: ATP citrate lyase citrate-binding domain-containing protein [Candidatus Saccharimonadales bacterium]
MPRKKISEIKAKIILYDQLGQSYAGVSIDTTRKDWRSRLENLEEGSHYVVKVDQGIKGRFKKGLVKLGRTKIQVEDDIVALENLGFTHMLIEPQVSHAADTERYLAFERARMGTIISWSERGGVNVEEDPGSIKRAPFSAEVAAKAAKALGAPAATLEKLDQAFEANYFSFLEINPLVTHEGAPVLLDAAVEVDTEAAFFVDGRWTPADFRDYSPTRPLPQIQAVERLAAQSQASFRLAVLNPQGSIFMLLSGGGASVLLADEVFNQGYGQELGNYGEYSGNPNTEETIIYTRQILSLMLESSAPHKVLVIAGGVANFTDVRATFKGVIAAMEEVKDKMADQRIKVYVRRGGPFEAEGLAMMNIFLEKAGLLGEVAGPEMMLADIIPRAISRLEVTK